MKRLLLLALFGASVLLQIILSQLGGFWQANFVLAALIICCIYLPFEYCLVSALAGGIILDSYSGGIFGFNTTFLLFVVIFSQLVLGLGTKNRSVSSVLGLTGLMDVLYIFLLLTMVFSYQSFVQVWHILSQLVWQVGSTIICVLAYWWLGEKVSRIRFKFSGKQHSKRLWQ